MTNKNQQQSATWLSAAEIKNLAGHVKVWERNLRSYTVGTCGPHSDFQGRRHIHQYYGKVSGIQIEAGLNIATTVGDNLIDPYCEVEVRVIKTGAMIGMYLDDPETRQTCDIARKAYDASEELRAQLLHDRPQKCREQITRAAVSRVRRLISGGKK